MRNSHVERRHMIVRLFCEGMEMKRIAAHICTDHKNVTHAVRFVMRQHGIKTHAQLGVWWASRSQP